MGEIIKHKKKRHNVALFVPWAGVEPARPLRITGF